MTARQDAIDRIDPIQSFNAWNLSSVCGPVSISRQGSKQQYRVTMVREQD